MTITGMILLFAIGSLMRLDILAWIVALPLLLVALLLLWLQHRQFHELKTDLSQLRKLKRHSIEYEMVLKAMKLCVWRIDVASRTITFESDYRETGDSILLPPSAPLDNVLSQFVDEHKDRMLKSVNDMIEGRTDDYHMQYQVKVAHSDRTYWSECYATIDKRDLNGKPLSIVGTSMRIDQQKEIEAMLMEAVYHAEESDRLKSAFLANISHEIRTPLNAIVGFSDVLTMVEDADERQKLVNLIKQNNTHLLRLFDDIVNMSRLEARGGEAIKKANFPLLPLFNELVEKFAIQSAETGVPIEIADGEKLPTLFTDCDRLREILSQYINNALKFTTKGKVTLGCTENEGKMRIWVRDTGKGIPAEKCNEQLFERFVKVDEFVPGTGLGLSICRSLAKTIGGEVGVESEYGKGSMFWVEL